MNWYRKAKKIIYIDSSDLAKLNLLVEKMAKGRQNWTSEDLQLQQTYPEAVEVLLKSYVNALPNNVSPSSL